jgi:hypothetical protein
MENNSIEVVVNDDDISLVVNVYFIRREYGKILVGRFEGNALEFDTYAQDEVHPAIPTLKIPEDFLQPLFDALGKNGIKPKQESFIAGELVATKLHLEDMREFFKLKQ